MNTESITCSNCTIVYDEKDHIPLFLPCCSQTICKGCVLKLSQIQDFLICPFCKHTPKLAELKRNLVVFSMVDEQSSKVCKTHKKILDLVCETCLTQICAACVKFHDSQHRLVDTAFFLKDCEESQKDWDLYLDYAGVKYHELYMIIDARKKFLRGYIDSNFEEMMSNLKKAHRNAHEELNRVFEKLDLQQFFILRTKYDYYRHLREFMNKADEIKTATAEDPDKFSLYSFFRRYELDDTKKNLYAWLNSDMTSRCKSEVNKVKVKFSVENITNPCTISIENNFEPFEMEAEKLKNSLKAYLQSLQSCQTDYEIIKGELNTVEKNFIQIENISNIDYSLVWNLSKLTKAPFNIDFRIKNDLLPIYPIGRLIKNLRLEISPKTETNETFQTNLAFMFKHLTNLHSLHIDIWAQEFDEFLLNFGEEICELRQLNNFGIKFARGSPYNPEIVADIIRKVKIYLPELQKFELHGNLSHEILMHELNDLFINKPALVSINIFSYFSSKFNPSMGIYENFGQLSELKSLCLNIYHKIDQILLDTFAHCLGDMPHLLLLSIGMWVHKTNTRDYEFKDLWKSIQSRRNLRVLSIDFRSNAKNNTVSYNLKSLFKAIQTLNLIEFSSCFEAHAEEDYIFHQNTSIDKLQALIKYMKVFRLKMNGNSIFKDFDKFIKFFNEPKFLYQFNLDLLITKKCLKDLVLLLCTCVPWKKVKICLMRLEVSDGEVEDETKFWMRLGFPHLKFSFVQDNIFTIQLKELT